MAKNENYYVVHGWMVNELGLKGNALNIYAIIYGFSQTDHQEYTASINYMAEWLGASRPTVINTLRDLVDKGYLTKTSNEINGVTFNKYRAVVPDFTGGKNILLGSKKILPEGSKKILPNKEYNITKNIKKESIPFSEILSYLNEKAGTSFRSSSKDTQKHITARWNDGYRLEDFFRVIDVKVSEWKYDKKMAQYLRPSTLFGTKFESYLQQYKEPQKKASGGSELVRNEDGSLMTF